MSYVGNHVQRWWEDEEGSDREGEEEEGEVEGQKTKGSEGIRTGMDGVMEREERREGGVVMELSPYQRTRDVVGGQ